MRRSRRDRRRRDGLAARDRRIAMDLADLIRSARRCCSRSECTSRSRRLRDLNRGLIGDRREECGERGSTRRRKRVSRTRRARRIGLIAGEALVGLFVATVVFLKDRMGWRRVLRVRDSRIAVMAAPRFSRSWRPTCLRALSKAGKADERPAPGDVVGRGPGSDLPARAADQATF